MSQPPPMMLPFATMLGQQEPQREHGLSEDAQKDNLLAAFSYYSARKRFDPGMIVRERQGLSVFTHKPVILWLRWLNRGDSHDDALAERAYHQMRWNKVDCVIMIVDDQGCASFHAHDSDVLEVA